jgi:hypothetical protein
MLVNYSLAEPVTTRTSPKVVIREYSANVSARYYQAFVDEAKGHKNHLTPTACVFYAHREYLLELC